MTLVELLVAISVLGIIAVLGWRGLDGIVRARIALAGDLEQMRGMQLTFAQLQNDCAHLATPSTLANRAPLVAGQGRITLVRTIVADNQPTRLQVIAYRVNDGVLTRRESASTRDLMELDALWRAAAKDSDTAQAVVLQSGVAVLATRLWRSDGNGWRAGIAEQTPAVPDGATASPLAPSGLEVAMQLQGREASMLKIFLLGAV